jgi:hypothetical protein
VVDVDVAAGDAGALQRVDLVIWVLVSGGDARVALEHVSKYVIGRSIRRSFSTRVLDADPGGRASHAGVSATTVPDATRLCEPP